MIFKLTKQMNLYLCAKWEELLSFQARLFFHCPKYGILDECTKYVSIFFFILSFHFLTTLCGTYEAPSLQCHKCGR